MSINFFVEAHVTRQPGKRDPALAPTLAPPPIAAISAPPLIAAESLRDVINKKQRESYRKRKEDSQWKRALKTFTLGNDIYYSIELSPKDDLGKGYVLNASTGVVKYYDHNPITNIINDSLPIRNRTLALNSMDDGTVWLRLEKKIPT